MKLIKRILLASLGMMIYGLGNYLTIQANIGVGPWEALSGDAPPRVILITIGRVVWIGKVVAWH